MLFMQSVSDGLSAHSRLNSKLGNTSFSVTTVPIAPQTKTIEEPDLIKQYLFNIQQLHDATNLTCNSLFLGSSFQTVSATEMDGTLAQQQGVQQFNHIVSDICNFYLVTLLS